MIRRASRIARQGFTIVELLVVMAILALLMALILGGLWRATIAAKVSRTEALIDKLNAQVMVRYESYRNRRVPIDIPPPTGNTPWPIEQLQLVRLAALYDLMRMEMPDRWSDVTTPPQTISPINRSVGNPALRMAYLRYINARGGNPSVGYQGAECLYMMLTVGMSKTGVRSGDLSKAETGDVDADGFPEFIDGFGKPVSFLRWAPGFVSDVQPAITVKPPSENPSPLDPLKVLIKNSNGAAGQRLIPLIFSAGPDGYYGLLSTGGNAAPNDPYGRPYGGVYAGDPPGSLADNIHNHSIAPR